MDTSVGGGKWKKQQRKGLSLINKVNILKGLDKGVNKMDMCKLIKVPRSTIYAILRDRDKIMEAYSSQTSMGANAEPKLIETDSSESTKSSRSTTPESSEEESFDSELQIKQEEPDDDSNEINFDEVLEEYDSKDIFSIQQTSFLWNLLPNNVLKCKEDSSYSDKDRITIVLSTNLNGSEKLDPIVIGKVKKPRAFRRIKSMQVKYEANSEACLTAEILKSWISEQDNKFLSMKRRVLLIVNKRSSKLFEPSVLKAIHLIVNPQNRKNLTRKQNLHKKAITQSLIHHYRKKLMQSILLHLNGELEYEWDFLKSMHNISYAWQEVSSCVISQKLNSEKSFSPVISNDLLIDQLRQKGMEIPDEVTGDLYDTVDSQRDCYSLDNNLIDHLDSDEVDKEEKTENNETFQLAPTVAMRSLETLRLYFASSDKSKHALDMLTELEQQLFASNQVQKCLEV